MDLNEIVIFIKVAQLGSFISAAKQLNLPKSTVSTKISALEKRLGVSLIHRTTRKINLTPIGQQFYSRCVDNIESLKNAEEEVSFSKKSPSGKIVISAPSLLGSYFLPEVICRYKKEFPDVQVELILTDRHVDIISEGVDLALRAGKLNDSTLIAKKIGETYFGLFASAEYLKKNGKLQHPKDLKDHNCLQFATLGKDKWSLTNAVEKQSVTVPMKQSFVADDLYIIKTLTLKSQGLALLPTFLCKDELKNKDLIPVLPNWRTEVRPIHFVYPSQRYLLPKVKSFIEKSEGMI